jgi:NAD(P)-dependent dehydrogenase (short-subunit alcohol dehydrogenase family)
MNIENSVALVTGANRGIGEGCVRALLAAGAKKVYAGTRQLSGAGHLIDEFGASVVPIELDVTIPSLVAAAAQRCSDVNVLVNNAGVFNHHTLMGAPDDSAARHEMEVNFWGPLNMCRAFAPLLKNNGRGLKNHGGGLENNEGGAIVNVLSAAAIVSVPAMGGYSASKFAARCMTTSIRAELMGQGTQCGALIVGSVDTDLASHVQGQKAKPLDIGHACVKLISENIHEYDTDPMAIGVRKQLALDPEGLESKMIAMLSAQTLHTGLSS